MTINSKAVSASDICQIVIKSMTKKEAKQLVDSWVWNVNIFDIYDYLKEEDRPTQRRILKQCLKTFNESRSVSHFIDLAEHLNHGDLSLH